MRKQEQKVNSQGFSGRRRCRLQGSRRWRTHWTREPVRRPGGKNTMSIWSNGRAIQWKMPAGRMKRKYKSMDIPCKSSWIGAHESFQAEEYDAGASTNTSNEPAWSGRQLESQHQNFENILGILRKSLMKPL